MVGRQWARLSGGDGAVEPRKLRHYRQHAWMQTSSMPPLRPGPKWPRGAPSIRGSCAWNVSDVFRPQPCLPPARRRRAEARRSDPWDDARILVPRRTIGNRERPADRAAIAGCRAAKPQIADGLRYKRRRMGPSLKVGIPKSPIMRTPSRNYIGTGIQPPPLNQYRTAETLTYPRQCSARPKRGAITWLGCIKFFPLNSVSKELESQSEGASADP
jgi:hypothetical protein